MHICMSLNISNYEKVNELHSLYIIVMITLNIKSKKYFYTKKEIYTILLHLISYSFY